MNYLTPFNKLWLSLDLRAELDLRSTKYTTISPIGKLYFTEELFNLAFLNTWSRDRSNQIVLSFFLESRPCFQTSANTSVHSSKMDEQPRSRVEGITLYGVARIYYAIELV